MPLRALAYLGIHSYEPAKSDQGDYSGVQCRLAKSHRQDSSQVPNMGSEDWAHFLRDWRWHLLNFLLGSTAWYLPPFINASNTLMRREGRSSLGICRQEALFLKESRHTVRMRVFTTTAQPRQWWMTKARQRKPKHRVNDQPLRIPKSKAKGFTVNAISKSMTPLTKSLNWGWGTYFNSR